MFLASNQSRLRVVKARNHFSNCSSKVLFESFVLPAALAKTVRSCALAQRALAATVCVLGVIVGQFPFSHAESSESGIALRELQLEPVSTIRRLIDLGCRDIKKVTKHVRPFKERKEGERTIRYYEYRGLNLVTEAVQFEEPLSSSIHASSLAAWGLISGDGASLIDVERKFGKPTETEDAAALYTSQHDERTIVFVRLNGNIVRQFDWSCE